MQTEQRDPPADRRPWSIFPHPCLSVIRLFGALLAEQSDEWAVTKRHLGAESMKAARQVELCRFDRRPAMEALLDDRSSQGATPPTRRRRPTAPVAGAPKYEINRRRSVLLS